MKQILVFLICLLIISSCKKQSVTDTQKATSATLSKEQLKDKIMGGWAGQTIGVTFGGPYEFRFQGAFIGDYQPLLWYDGYLKKTMENTPGLYDDLYMDLTFVLKGSASPWANTSDYVFNTELYLDDELIEKPLIPVDFTTRRHELCWKYQIPKGKHTVKLKILNPSKEHVMYSSDAIIYSDKPVDGMQVNIDKAKVK